MKNSSLLSLCLLLLLAGSPLAVAGAWSQVSCGSDDGSYRANSTYETNLRRLATALMAEASASPGRYVYMNRAIGYWPNRLQAEVQCWNGDDGGGCAACIADAFKRVEIDCPFNKEAGFSSRNCSLSLGEVRISDIIFSGSNSFVFGRRIGRQTITSELIQACFASGLIFQAIGFACLFFLLLQEWRGRKKGTTTMLSTPLVAEDQ